MVYKLLNRDRGSYLVKISDRSILLKKKIPFNCASHLAMAGAGATHVLQNLCYKTQITFECFFLNA